MLNIGLGEHLWASWRGHGCIKSLITHLITILLEQTLRDSVQKARIFQATRHGTKQADGGERWVGATEISNFLCSFLFYLQLLSFQCYMYGAEHRMSVVRIWNECGWVFVSVMAASVGVAGSGVSVIARHMKNRIVSIISLRYLDMLTYSFPSRG